LEIEMTTHNHDPLMVIESRIINGHKGGSKQLAKDYRALQKARTEILRLREKVAFLEGCQCHACKDEVKHWSDCAVHNAPAMPAGPCDCGKLAQPNAGGNAT
jgi:hypothetical protein